jgi:peptidoglycan lytic transglycosylase G
MRRALLVLVLLVAIVAGCAATILYLRMDKPYKGYASAEQFVDIAPRSSTRTIEKQLIDAGVVSDAPTFRTALWLSGAQRRLRAGEYRFDRPMRPSEVIQKLARGDVYERLITFPEGLTLREMAAIFESKGFGPAASFVQAAGDPSPVADIDPQARDLEGYLFPETYALPRNTPAERLIRLMADRFTEVYTADLRKEVAASGRTTREVMTIASLVEKETARPEERPIVAGVYYNRLRIGMGLQCDPTVVYALQKAGRYTGNITKADLAFDSPYNTYKHAGLPPGPIASPGRSAIEAAVRPRATDFLYFVSRNDGSHVFAKTLEEHNRNVQEYQVRYFRERNKK